MNTTAVGCSTEVRPTDDGLWSVACSCGWRTVVKKQAQAEAIARVHTSRNGSGGAETGKTLAIVIAAVAGIGGLLFVVPAAEEAFGSPTTVVYQVTGSAKAVDITMETPTGTSQQDNVSVPLKPESGSSPGLPIGGFKRGDFVYISAQRANDVGGGPDIRCEIVVDGVTISENMASGGASIATCSGSVP